MTDENQIRDFMSNGGLLIDRGYTSHEHFAEVGLIHMNGRLYDPLLRRFLNADENIQDMFNTQNYNKYGYVLNNPLMYNDPSGEVFFLIPLVGYFWSAVIVGAVIGAASYLVSSAIMGQAITLKGFLKSTLWGGISGAVTFGIGSIFSVAGSTALTATGTAIKEAVGGVGLAIVQAGTHAIAQGVMSLMQGGTFQQAFWSGALGSLGASAFGAVAGDFANKAVGQIAFGAVSGGIGAELSGGNFWQGAVIGGIVAGLNHAMHEIGNGEDPPKGKSLKDSIKEKYIEIKEQFKEGIEYVSDFYGGVNDFIDTYNEMKEANWKMSDKYFHSKANYKATLRGPGGEAAAIKMSNLREITDQRIKGDSRASSLADQKANAYGRQQAHLRANFVITDKNIPYILNKYRPKGLPSKY
nr:RHS repeat-associated core domain-containing protein [Chryseobacterium taklimakanense]